MTKNGRLFPRTHAEQAPTVWNSGEARAEGKRGRTTCHHRADSGQKTDSMYVLRAINGRTKESGMALGCYGCSAT